MTASHRFDESDELRLTLEASSFPEALIEAGRALGDLVDGAQSGERLRVMARGSTWPERSFPVKAATLNRARVTETAAGVVAEVTLDV